jgi:hypothetical protein
MTSSIEPFSDESAQPPVRGFLHRPDTAAGDALILTHGAGSNCNAPLLVAIAGAFSEAGISVLRCDLPYRQRRPSGPPFPGESAQDREGIRRAVAAIRRLTPGRVFLGGHSYGGRQASMAAAEDPALAGALLLFSYPLHPPRKPGDPRTAHFPHLRTRVLFVHGSRDPFGSIEDVRAAMALIPAPAELLEVDGAGHDLAQRRSAGKSAPALPLRVLDAFQRFVNEEAATF